MDNDGVPQIHTIDYGVYISKGGSWTVELVRQKNVDNFTK
jgi:hypothetical protein